MDRIISCFGLLAMILTAYLFSTDRKKIAWKTVGSGLLIQILLGLFVLKTELGKGLFQKAQDWAIALLNFTNEGASFIFGPLVNNELLAQNFGASNSFIFATMVLPTIIFVSAFMSVLYYLGIMQKIIKVVAWMMMRLMKISGAESMAAAANIFAGQTEAPLVIKPYVSKMTRSELLSLMTGGMATIAGGVMAAYVGMGIDAGHLLAASVMSAPAAIICAKLMVPETKTPETLGNINLKTGDEKKHTNVIDAAADGALDGMKLAFNVGAMLLAFIALVAVLNHILGFLGGLVGFENFGLELIFGYLFAPFAYLMGIPSNDILMAGSLLGKKVVINELIAYLDLVEIKESLSPRSVTLLTYALCGFANFSSIAIQVGGIGALAPERRKDLAVLGIKSLIGGTLACFMTACVAGIFI